MTINPKLQEHIDTIFYDKNGRIASTNPDFNKDIDDILNLNFEEFIELRGEAFKKSFDNLLMTAKHLKLSKKEAYKRGLKVSNSGKMDFPSYLSYRYKKLLDHIKG